MDEDKSPPGIVPTLESSSSSPRRPRLTSSKDRSRSSGGGSRSPRPRNALTEHLEEEEELQLSQALPVSLEHRRADSFNSNTNPSSGSDPSRSDGDHARSSREAEGRPKEQQQHQHAHRYSNSQVNESDFPSLIGSSGVSNFPGMSGIGLAQYPVPSSPHGKAPSIHGGIYSSSPPVNYNTVVGGSGGSSHLAKVGAGAATSSTTTTSASGHRSRSRLPSRNSGETSSDFHREGSSSHSTRRRQNSQERPKTGVSSGTSNSNSSTWSFFRSSSSAHLAPRASHSELYSPIHEKNEAILSPATGRSGVSTPLVYDAGHTTPIPLPSGLNEELRKRIANLRSDSHTRRQRSSINYSASCSLSEGAATMPTTPGASFLSASKRKGRKGSISAFASSEQQPRRRAEGLVAMAASPENTAESSKVVIAGRNLLKILSITQPQSDDDESEDEGQGSEFAWNVNTSAPSNKRNRPGVKIEKEIDLHAGLVQNGKNPKAALINDVGWGFDYTADKIMTGNSNGTVALYDLGKGESKLERVKTHHQSGRAINIVSFAGPAGQGTLLASGCQDGDIKISDVRHASIITLSIPLDPIRTMCFAPRHGTTADSFQLISAYESGNLVRWDLRMPKNPIERLMAHQGGVLSVDWKGASENSHLMTDISSEEGTASPSHNWGWLATAGMDGTVKVWDMSAAGHTPQLAHTLHVGRPSHFVRWLSDPNRPCDLVVTPSPMTGSTVGSFDDTWQPDVEIWDVRREYLPKQTFWLGGSPVSTLSPVSNPEVLWCLNRKTAALQQVDIVREAVRPLDYIPRVAATWSSDGLLAFAVGSSSTHVDDDTSTNLAAQKPATIQTAGLITGIDPTFDVQAFRYLADQYLFSTGPESSFAELCRHNAEVAMRVDHYDTAKIWRLLEQWVEPDSAEGAACKSVAAEETAPEQEITHSTHPEDSKSPSRRRPRAGSRASPASPFAHFQPVEVHQSRQSSPLVTSHVINETDVLSKLAPLKLPPPKMKAAETKDSNNADLVGSDSSASSSMQDEDDINDLKVSSTLSPRNDTVVGLPAVRRLSNDRHTEAQSTHGASLPSHLLLKRRPTLSSVSQHTSNSSARTVTRPSSSANIPLVDSAASIPRPTSRQLGKTMPENMPLPSALSARDFSKSSTETAREAYSKTGQWGSKKDPGESSASGGENDEDSEVDDDEQDLTAEALRARGFRQYKNHKRRARARQSRSKSRRRGYGSAEDKPKRTVSGRQSRSVSAARKGFRSLSKERAQALQENISRISEDVHQTLSSRFSEHLKEIMQGLADEGDVQTSATIACAVRKVVHVDSQFLARITTAYLDLLRKLDCHLPSATVVKDSPIESIKSISQDNTTIRTACGNCEKAIHNAPYAKCRKCASDITTCSICHLIGTAHWIFCPTCGHGAHEDCLYEYAAEVSRSSFSGQLHERMLSALPTPTTVPSSPFVAMDSPSGHWLFPSEQALFIPASNLPSRMHSRATSPDVPQFDQNALESRALLLNQCPSGCGHSCLLALPLSDFPDSSWVY